MSAVRIEKDGHAGDGAMDQDNIASNAAVDAGNGSNGTSDRVRVNHKLLGEHRVMNRFSPTAVFDAYNMLRTKLVQLTNEKQQNMIMVTSATPGEGKALTALNLAMSITRNLNQNALLVEADMRTPKISNYLGLYGRRGLRDYLLGNYQMSDLMVRLELGIKKGQEKKEHYLTFLPAGKKLTVATELINSEPMIALAREMKEKYNEDYLNRYVIFSCPSVLNTPDTLAFSEHIDAIIMVVKSGVTPREKVLKALDMLKNRNVLGLVLNESGIEHI